MADIFVSSVDPKCHHVVGWKIIPFATSFAISTDGEVRRIKAGPTRAFIGRVSLHNKGRGGYPFVNLTCDDGAYRKKRIHTLLGIVFLKKGHPGQTEVAHCDGDKLNFKLSNLKWKTHKENSEDTRLHGTMAVGDKHGNVKIPDKLIPMIRAHAGSMKPLADALGVRRHTLTEIRACRQRKSVPY